MLSVSIYFLFRQSNTPTAIGAARSHLSVTQPFRHTQGAWLYFEGVQVAQGRDAAKDELKRNKELYGRIEKAALAKLKGGEAPESIGATVAP